MHHEVNTGGEYELLYVRSNPVMGHSVHIGLVYRSPSGISSNWIHTMRLWAGESHVCLIGDFNCSHNCWRTITSRPGDTQIEREVLEFTFNSGLTQRVDFPTGCLPGSTSCLDLLLIIQDSRVGDVRRMDPVLSSDHMLVLAHSTRLSTHSTL